MDKMYNEDVLKSEDILWRYMDLSKFIYIISKKKLYFSSAMNFNDPFEGAKGYMRDEEKYLEEFKKSHLGNYGTADQLLLKSMSKNTYENFIIDGYKSMREKGKEDVKKTFINCWYCNNYESEAMWKVYSKDITNAIAIQATCQKLKDAFKDNKKIKIAKVQYKDYNYTDIDRDVFLTKRKSFDYEKEVRAIIISKKDKDEAGIAIDIDVSTLIDKIYISPYAPVWFYDMLKDIISKYGINKEVFKSEMQAEPYFLKY